MCCAWNMWQGGCNALGDHIYIIYSMYKVSLNLPFLEAFPVTLMLASAPFIYASKDGRF